MELYATVIMYPPQILSNFVIIMKIICQLTRKGMSPKLMRIILLRYILVFFAILPFFITSAIYYLGKQVGFHWVTTNLLLLFESLSLTLALCIVIIRTCEPFVYGTIKEILADGCRCGRKKKKKSMSVVNGGKNLDMTGSFKVSEKIERLKFNENDLNSFLNKAFNVEYVYLILTGVSRIMTAQS